MTGNPARARAFAEVTSGGVFWMVAVGPARWAMRIRLMGGTSGGKQLLFKHHVDALGAIDGLRHVQIAGEAAKHVGVGAG